MLTQAADSLNELDDKKNHYLSTNLSKTQWQQAFTPSDHSGVAVENLWPNVETET